MPEGMTTYGDISPRTAAHVVKGSLKTKPAYARYRKIRAGQASAQEVQQDAGLAEISFFVPDRLTHGRRRDATQSEADL